MGLQLLGAQHVGEGELNSHRTLHGAAVAEMGPAAGVADPAVWAGERGQLRVGEHRLDELARSALSALPTRSGEGASRIITSGVIATRLGAAPRVVPSYGPFVGGLVSVEHAIAGRARSEI